VNINNVEFLNSILQGGTTGILCKLFFLIKISAEFCFKKVFLGLLLAFPSIVALAFMTSFNRNVLEKAQNFKNCLKNSTHSLGSPGKAIFLQFLIVCPSSAHPEIYNSL
jgi:hypothetical protein